mmetsp:Transcript_127081/g.353836  ORF Transcript_127081/g.353836 Transcript_127081/m.353836 type:complete len:251 (-) Transcript_127081:598-1350(-)
MRDHAQRGVLHRVLRQEPGLDGAVEVQQLRVQRADRDVRRGATAVGAHDPQRVQDAVVKALDLQVQDLRAGHGGAAEAGAVPLLTKLRIVAVHGQKPWWLRHASPPQGLLAVVEAVHPLLYLRGEVRLLPALEVDDEDAPVGNAGRLVERAEALPLHLLSVDVIPQFLEAVLHGTTGVAPEVHVVELTDVPVDQGVRVYVDHPPVVAAAAAAVAYEELLQVEGRKVEGARQDLPRLRGPSERDEPPDLRL